MYDTHPFKSFALYFHLQLTAELDRAMGKHLSQEFREGWENLVSTVIAIAEEECDNTTIQTLISLAPAALSDGE